MATASFVFTTPIAQPSHTGVLLGSPITIDIGSGQAIVPYASRTAGGAVSGTETKLSVNLTAADFTTIMGIIIERARANGASIPEGAITVGA